MAKKQTETQTIGERIAGELSGDSQQIAESLFSEVMGGAKKLPKQEYLQLIQRNWGNASFRQNLLQRIGPHNFLETAKEAGIIPDLSKADQAANAATGSQTSQGAPPGTSTSNPFASPGGMSSGS